MQALLAAKCASCTSGMPEQRVHRIYVDPFCGLGRIKVGGEVATGDGAALVAWRQSVAAGAGFAAMLVGDVTGEHAESCACRLAALGAPARAFKGPADQTIRGMLACVPTRALVLAFIDPYSLEHLSFNIFRELARLPEVDFAVHFSMTDLQRNVDMDDASTRFDRAAPGWRSSLPIEALAKGELRLAYLSYWMHLVSELGFDVGHEVPLLRGQGNEPLHRVVFFSRASSAMVPA